MRHLCPCKRKLAAAPAGRTTAAEADRAACLRPPRGKVRPATATVSPDGAARRRERAGQARAPPPREGDALRQDALPARRLGDGTRLGRPAGCRVCTRESRDPGAAAAPMVGMGRCARGRTRQDHAAPLIRAPGAPGQVAGRNPRQAGGRAPRARGAGYTMLFSSCHFGRGAPRTGGGRPEAARASGRMEGRPAHGARASKSRHQQRGDHGVPARGEAGMRAARVTGITVLRPTRGGRRGGRHAAGRSAR
jgi:hypothetical protein